MTQVWDYDETQVEEFQGFEIIPEGKHRVRINNVVPETSKSGNDMIKLTLDVSGHKGKLFHYIVFHTEQEKKKYTHTNLFYIFSSFGIQKGDMDYNNWLNKAGACHIKHEDYQGSKNAKIAYFIKKEEQDDLPAWIEKGNGKKQTTIKEHMAANANNNDNSDIPF